MTPRQLSLAASSFMRFLMKSRKWDEKRSEFAQNCRKIAVFTTFLQLGGGGIASLRQKAPTPTGFSFSRVHKIKNFCVIAENRPRNA